jgi:shikimate kinase
MGSGKTTVGALLARRLDRPFRDGDVRLEAMTGKTAAQLAAERGGDVLHHLEVEVLARGLGERPAPVIAAAAAVVLDPRVPSLLGGAWSVWLRTDVSELVARLAGVEDHRPLARGDLLATLREMARIRDPLYARIADLSLDARHAAPAALVGRILEAMPAGV